MRIRHHLTTFLPLVKSGIALLAVLFRVLIKPYYVTFTAAAFLNFVGRLLHLIAFVVSIQSIVIAFNFAQSDGENIPFRSLFTYSGIPTDYLPAMLSAAVFLVFSSSALVKKLEMILLSGIVSRMHDRALQSGGVLSVDLYITQTIPNYLNSTCQLLSGICFVIGAVLVLAVFRLDLFFFIVILSTFLAIVSLLLSFRRINKKQSLDPIKNQYILEARENVREISGESNLRPLDETAILAGKSRNEYFSRTLANWVVVSRSSANGSIVVGLAMATIVWFVFTMHNFDNNQIFRLLYIVIAIRFAVNTAQNVGNLLAKLLESRMDLDKLLHIEKMR